jgi:hypothetical protein
MAGKIFCRERTKVGEGKMQPQFRVVAVAGVDLSFSGPHFRKNELEQIAQAVGAEIVYLSQGKGEGKYKTETK